MHSNFLLLIKLTASLHCRFGNYVVNLSCGFQNTNINNELNFYSFHDKILPFYILFDYIFSCLLT